MMRFVSLRRAFIVSCALAALLVPWTSARADEPSGASGEAGRPSAVPLAESLFQEGRALVEKNDFEGACPKFEASLKLDPAAVGTMLNIAICKEKTGKLATAWGLYREVAMRSRGSRPDRYERANTSQNEIAPRLSTLTVSAPSERPPGFVLKIDGLSLDAAAWSTPLPVDGGEHTIEASAPGFVPFRATARVEPERDKASLVVPPLEPAKVAPPPDEPARGSSSTRTVGMVMAGAGVVALGVGGVFGIDVLTRSDAPAAACPSPCIRGTDAANESDRRYDVLKREAILADVLLPVGAVATLAGAYLWLVSGDRGGGAKSSGRLVPYVGPSAAGVHGSF